MKILPIASGSTGNSMLLDLDGRRLLIDLGVSASILKQALTENGYGFDAIDAVLITHTHSDHVKGLAVCMKRIAAPIFMSGSSRDRLMMERAKPLLYSARTEILPGLWVTAIPTSHDCPGSVGFKIETEDVCVGYLTDLGCIPESTMDLLYGAGCIVIESNHDEEMLRYGSYPAYLKRRILSDQGHLSNVSCAEAIARFAEKGTRRFFLAHLSQENNRPELALDSAVKATAGMNVSISVLPVYGGRIMEID
ncbi:MAG: MBL fold metallo-hydrolase [Eubacteriales bacterium]|jgi:phosphoribosyl 1,2-cyclic phosphodiesterase|nr:MBL fold metallo-hydrolase [Eubacteriales bacterium]